MVKKALKIIEKYFIKRIKAILNLIFHPIRISHLILFDEYLKKTGWYNSRNKNLPLDLELNPIPWYTYSSINFLNKRIKKGMKVFEFGSGNSTIWFANKGCIVTSIEHDQKWYLFLKKKLPSNVKYNYLPLSYNGEYCRSICKHDTLFDIIIIDGRDRVNCALNSINNLNKSGIIIWDNSDRKYYQEGFEFLKRNGFKRLEFNGHGPINTRFWETSIFYKEENCLEI